MEKMDSLPGKNVQIVLPPYRRRADRAPGRNRASESRLGRKDSRTDFI
jgi:hypothetical protein